MQDFSGSVDLQLIPDAVPVVPIAGTVVFPHVVLPLGMSADASNALLRDAVQTHKRVLFVAVQPGRRADENDDAEPPFFGVGTLGAIVHIVELPDTTTRLLVQALRRVRVLSFERRETGWIARIEAFGDDVPAGDERVEALNREIRRLYDEILSLSPNPPVELRKLIAEIEDPAQLADMICANVPLDLEEKQELLEEGNVQKRLELLLNRLTEERRVMQFGSELRRKVSAESSRTQREYWLREQLRLIQDELGDEDSDVARFRQQADSCGMPQAVREHVDRELRRLERTSIQAPDYQLVRNYVEWLLALPWSKESEESIDLAHSREILDRDHYDLDDVKQRIIEHLAVRKLNPKQHGPILCFVGPPGVGKTSLGRSIAESLGRKFVRISLGGVHDEAEIRGHRRTYVGALPGRIIQAIRQSGVRNPVVLLDELDKVGQDFRGDPAAALLEVLDPAQNHTFTDHYLEVPFDLSRVMFIGTANTLMTIPPALLDRLEVQELSGYTTRQKFEIARRYLLPRQRAEAGLADVRFELTDEALEQLVTDYTREAGVRELERQIARIMRKLALRVVEAGEAPSDLEVNGDNLAEFAGKRRFEHELAGRTNEIGTAVALAYTPAGGQILFVEAVSMAGSGKIRLTGQLGEIMRESAQAALSYLNAHAAELQIPREKFDKRDLHVHVPAGATPKDGPSAGVALVAALASLLTGRPVKSDVAMTGEITLRGHVLPIGGLKEKLIAAGQAGIRTVLVPRRNEPDLAELQDEIRNTVACVLVETAEDVIAHALVERRVNERQPPIKLTAESNVA